jgi:hypothetical protein
MVLPRNAPCKINRLAEEMEIIEFLYRHALSCVISNFLGPLATVLIIICATIWTYSYIVALQELPVDYQVPTPPELSTHWYGKEWHEVGGKDKEILEGQATGVRALSLPVLGICLIFDGFCRFEECFG